MCEPMTIAATVAAGTTIAGGVVGAVSSYRSGKFNEAMAKRNARMAQHNASLAIQQGQERAGAIRAKGRAVASAATAAIGASNIDPGAGSAAGAVASSFVLSAADAETVKANAMRSAWGFQEEAADLFAQAENERRKGILGAVSSLL